MAHIYYGVWDNVVYDNRAAGEGGSAPEGLPIEQFGQFNSGNPMLSFVGDRGFMILSPRANIAHVLWKHHARIAQESCGKCTPCRAGSRLLLAALEKARRGRGNEVDWRQVREIAEQMHETALCGIGKTGPVALIAALTHFSDLLVNAPDSAHLEFDDFSTVTSRCIEACPAHVNVPRYIDYIKDGHPDLAAGVVLRHYPLVGSCGRVCVRLCESACRRNTFDTAVDIKNLKRFAADNTTGNLDSLFEGMRAPDNGLRVAIVGAGPAGITCAYHLLMRGYKVHIFEASPYAGGMARRGIPAYRLPKGLLQSETDVVTRLGGRFLYGQALGRDFSINSLFGQGYNAVFIGVGCSQGMYLGMEGEDTSLEGYQNGIEFLLKVHDGVGSGRPPRLTGDVVVVGRRQRGHGLRPLCRASHRRNRACGLPPHRGRRPRRPRGNPRGQGRGHSVPFPGPAGFHHRRGRQGEGTALSAHGTGRSGRQRTPQRQSYPRSHLGHSLFPPHRGHRPAHRPRHPA